MSRQATEIYTRHSKQAGRTARSTTHFRLRTGSTVRRCAIVSEYLAGKHSVQSAVDSVTHFGSVEAVLHRCIHSARSIERTASGRSHPQRTVAEAAKRPPYSAIRIVRAQSMAVLRVAPIIALPVMAAVRSVAGGAIVRDRRI